MTAGYEFTRGHPLPDSGLFGINRGFSDITIENTNRCGYSCFCCSHSSMSRKTGDMPIAGLNVVLNRLNESLDNFAGEFKLTGFGETLLLDDLPNRIKLIKKHYPDNPISFTTTLGVRRYEIDEVKHLISSGLGSIYISCYGYDREMYKAVHGVDRYDVVIDNIRSFSSVMGEFNFKMHVKYDGFINCGLPKKERINSKRKFIDFLESLGIESHWGQNLHNFGETKIYSESGNLSTNRVCCVVWGFMADRLTIHWNLDVVPCCKLLDGGSNNRQLIQK
jgi:hypothetical protein